LAIILLSQYQAIKITSKSTKVAKKGKETSDDQITESSQESLDTDEETDTDQNQNTELDAE